MTLAHQLRGEVMAKPRLRRNLAALIPGIAIAGNGKRLDHVGAEPGIPGKMLIRIGIGPKPGRRKAVRAAWSPVKVDAKGADRLCPEEPRATRLQQQARSPKARAPDYPTADSM